MKLKLPLLLSCVCLAASIAYAAQPSSGALDPSTTSPITWIGSTPGGSAPNGESSCVQGVNCETFTLTLSGTASDWSGKISRVKVEWLLPASDYDVYVHKDTLTGPEVARSANGLTTSEEVVLDPSRMGTGIFVVHVVDFASTLGDQYHGTASVEIKPAEPPPAPPSTATPPTYNVFAAPAPLGQSAGEPSIGANWATGNAMFVSYTETLRVTFNDSTTPPTASWVNKSAVNTSLASLDPILFTDSRTNRTFVSQLAGKASLMSFTDNDGETWTPSMGSGINSGVDHQTVGGGPFKPGVLGRSALTSYPDAVYYASQDSGLAEIALSRDGGLTFDVAVPMYNLTQCGGLHGHIKVAPDGTVYVPNESCGGHQAVVVSEDNGLTWNVRPVPNSIGGESDPSVGIGANGTVYFAYANGDGAARVAVSRDHGMTWTDDQDLGRIPGIKNTVFPEGTAGDDDRAAVFFLGTTTPGSNATGTDTSFNGTWYGYIATTYDGGKTWVTVNATPNDPVQRGVICTQGTTCPSGTRNLLDFNDLQVDQRGRALAGLADGCISAACIAGGASDGAAQATILRQASGRTLFSAYDAPNAPSSLSAASNRGVVTLAWTDGSNNESLFTVERSISSTTGFTQIGTVGANTTTFNDATGSKKTYYYYRLRAGNVNGTSPYSNVAKVYVK